MSLAKNHPMNKFGRMALYRLQQKFPDLTVQQILDRPDFASHLNEYYKSEDSSADMLAYICAQNAANTLNLELCDQLILFVRSLNNTFNAHIKKYAKSCDDTFSFPSGLECLSNESNIFVHINETIKYLLETINKPYQEAMYLINDMARKGELDNIVMGLSNHC